MLEYPRRRFASALRTRSSQAAPWLPGLIFIQFHALYLILVRILCHNASARQIVWPRFRLVVYSSFIIPSIRPSVLPSLSLLIFRHQEMQLTPSSSMGNCVQPNPHSLFSFFSYLISALLISLISYYSRASERAPFILIDRPLCLLQSG